MMKLSRFAVIGLLLISYAKCSLGFEEQHELNEHNADSPDFQDPERQQMPDTFGESQTPKQISLSELLKLHEQIPEILRRLVIRGGSQSSVGIKRRNPSRFHALRGKRMPFNADDFDQRRFDLKRALVSALDAALSTDFANGMGAEKRRMGFHAMRGKRHALTY